MSNLIYHYTSGDGLLGILSSKHLRMTNVNYLNDSSELQHGSELIFDYIKAVFESLKEPRKSELNIFDNPMIRQGLPKDFKEPIYQYFPEKLKSAEDAFYQLKEILKQQVDLSSFYTSSFCKNGDKLRQWMGYCSNGGYSIGFDREILEDKVISQSIDFTSVEYNNYINSSGLFHTMYSIVQELSNVIDNDEYDISQWVEKLTLYAHEVSHTGLMYKNDNFKDEEEVRAIYSEKHVDMNSIIDSEFFVKNNIFIPYKKLDFFKHAISEIIVGPMHHQSLACQSLYEFKRQNGYEFKIKKSSIPLREL
jgi:hypothetical protein